MIRVSEVLVCITPQQSAEAKGQLLQVQVLKGVPAPFAGINTLSEPAAVF